MLSVKRITTILAFVTMLLLLTVTCMAASPSAKADSEEKHELPVKEYRTKAGVVNVAVPYLSGAAGGKSVDDKVNQAVFDYVNAMMKQILSTQEAEAFDKEKGGAAAGDMIRYNSELAKYTNKMIGNRNDTGKVTASWYVRNDYEVKAARKGFYSVILKTKTYTGGPGDVITWKAMNFDLKDGSLLELKDLFEGGADYATRLQTLIGYQQMGRARLQHVIKGKELKKPSPVEISGEEDFYVDDHYNLGIILKSGKEGSTSVDMQVFDISLNDFADLVKL